jgi:hypothetical protein
MASARSHALEIIAEITTGGWMRRKWIIYTVAAALLMMLLNATAIAQDTQDTSTDQCAKKAGCVKTDYDRFKDQTTVLMTPVLLVPNNGYGNPLDGIQMAVIYSSSGTAIRRPDKVLVVFMATDISGMQVEPDVFKKSRDIDLLIEGASYPLGGVESLGRRSSTPIDDIFRPTWTYSLSVPFDVVEKIAAAKRVEIRVGSVETFLDEDTKAAFRRLVELAPKKESTPTNDKITPRDVKRPKPTRTRRRGRP